MVIPKECEVQKDPVIATRGLFVFDIKKTPQQIAKESDVLPKICLYRLLDEPLTNDAPDCIGDNTSYYSQNKLRKHSHTSFLKPV